MRSTLVLVVFAGRFVLAGAQDGVHAELGVGFGQDHGGLGVQLGVFPLEQAAVFGGAGLLPGGQFGLNAGLLVIPFPKWKDALFLCTMYGYHTGSYDREEQWPGAAYQLVGIKSDPSAGLNLYAGPSLGLGTRIGTREGTNHWKLALFFPIRSGEARDMADALDMMPVTLSIGYHFKVN